MEYIGFLGAAGTMPSLLSMAYLGAGILFILSLGGLSSQESARKRTGTEFGYGDRFGGNHVASQYWSHAV